MLTGVPGPPIPLSASSSVVGTKGILTAKAIGHNQSGMACKVGRNQLIAEGRSDHNVHLLEDLRDL